MLCDLHNTGIGTLFAQFSAVLVIMVKMYFSTMMAQICIKVALFFLLA